MHAYNDNTVCKVVCKVMLNIGMRELRPGKLCITKTEWDERMTKKQTCSKLGPSVRTKI